MKKGLLILLLTNCYGPVFTLEKSVGFGGQLALQFSALNMSYGGHSFREKIGSEKIFGIFGFFDITYAEFDIDIRYHVSDDYYYTRAVTFTPAIYGKYPILLESFSVFPLLGIEYQIYLYIAEDYNNADMNSFWIKAGLGGRFALSDKSFLYISFRYGIKVFSEYESKIAARFGDVNARYFTHGPDIKFAIGYKL